MTLDFTPPPRPKGGGVRNKWVSVADELRARPGEWAKLPGDHSASTVGNIKRGMLKGFTEGQFDATSRKAGARYHVWVRFIGKES